MSLMAALGKLSNHLINWFRVWYNSQIKGLKFYVGSPYFKHDMHVLKTNIKKEVKILYNFFIKKTNDIYQGLTFQCWSNLICLQKIGVFLYTSIQYGQLSYMNKNNFIHILQNYVRLGDDYRLDRLSERVVFPRIFWNIRVSDNNIPNANTDFILLNALSNNAS